MVLSVGYALFSDTITINETAKSKWSFDITTTCETGISSKLGTAESLGLGAEDGLEKDTCSVEDDIVSINVGILYPKARRHFRLNTLIPEVSTQFWILMMLIMQCNFVTRIV